MRRIGFIIFGVVFFFSCAPDTEPENTGNMMEYKVDEDSLATANGESI